MADNRRTMIVTGASSGIGRALALVAAKAGYAVLLVARRGHRLDETVRAIHATGGRAAALVADVTAADAPKRIVAAALQTFGRIDVLVNNAGSGAYGELLSQSDAEIDAQWQLHVAAPLRIARAALFELQRAHGMLVFVGSGLARVPLPVYGAYAPAKAAVRAAAVQLRRELRPRGIGVTYVDPGMVATEFHGAMGTERSSRIKAVAPEPVARAILRGIVQRKATVNAVAWQTAGTIAGEWLATLADPAIERMRPAAIARDIAPVAEPAPPAPKAPEPETSQPDGDAATGLGAALASVARRMERVKLPESFVRAALVPGTTLELNELAMRWAGMPNKNERAALRDVFDTLSGAGYLEPIGDETWKVLRAAD